MNNFATIADIEVLWRPLSDEERERATSLLSVISDTLRAEAKKVGKDLDQMIESETYLLNVAKSVVVDVIGRTLMTSTNQEPMTQMSQAAMGYSVSGTYLIPGGGIFIKKSELSKLGLRRQRYGVINFYENDPRDNG